MRRGSCSLESPLRRHPEQLPACDGEGRAWISELADAGLKRQRPDEPEQMLVTSGGSSGMTSGSDFAVRRRPANSTAPPAANIASSVAMGTKGSTSSKRPAQMSRASSTIASVMPVRAPQNAEMIGSHCLPGSGFTALSHPAERLDGPHHSTLRELRGCPQFRSW